MQLIKKGAEGDLFLTKWNNANAILKYRKKKDYRHPKLDQRIRKQRTTREAEILSEVKSLGIHTPLVYFVDTKKCTILMQNIPGIRVDELSDSQLIECCKEIGSIVGKMHKNGITHGDLTTSNFIKMDDKIFVIDFGLSFKTMKPEDHAVDLRLFKEILTSAHTQIMKKSWNNFLSGYRKKVGSSYCNKVTKLVSIIESRGRYATVI